MNIMIVDGRITGSAWIIDSVNNCWGVFVDEPNGMGHLAFRHSSESLSFELEGKVYPSKELIRGVVTLGYSRKTGWDLALHDSVTAIKQ